MKVDINFKNSESYIEPLKLDIAKIKDSLGVLKRGNLSFVESSHEVSYDTLSPDERGYRSNTGYVYWQRLSLPIRSYDFRGSIPNQQEINSLIGELEKELQEKQADLEVCLLEAEIWKLEGEAFEREWEAGAAARLEAAIRQQTEDYILNYLSEADLENGLKRFERLYSASKTDLHERVYDEGWSGDLDRAVRLYFPEETSKMLESHERHESWLSEYGQELSDFIGFIENSPKKVSWEAKNAKLIVSWEGGGGFETVSPKGAIWLLKEHKATMP